MFKDVFVLKKTAYHARMMKYIWGLDYHDFSHICPYWWLSVFNHFAFPFVFAFKEGTKLLIYLIKLAWKVFWVTITPPFKAINAWLDEVNRKNHIRHEAKLALKREKERAVWDKWAAYYKANPEKLVKIREKKESVYDKIVGKIREFHYSEWEKIQTKVWTFKEKLEAEKWEKEALEREEEEKRLKELRKKEFLSIYRGDDTEALLADGGFDEYLRNWKRLKTQRDIEAEANRRRAAKDRINRILKITKPITTILAYTLGTGLVGVVLYYVWKFLYWIWEGIQSVPHSNYVEIGQFLKTAGLWLLAIVALIGFILLIVFLSTKLKRAGITFPRIKWPRTLTYRYYFPRKSIPHWDYQTMMDRRDNEKLRRLKREENQEKYFFNPIMKFFGIFVFIWEKILCKGARGVRNAILFLIQMVKNNCPAIEWKD